MSSEVSFSPHRRRGVQRMLGRLFEILPGALSWTIIIGVVLLCVFRPLLAALVVIAFVLSWLFRLVYSNIFLAASYFRLTAERGTDWMERLAGLGDIPARLRELESERRRLPFRRRLSLSAHRRELLRLLASGSLPPPLQEIYHVVIIPIVGEGRDIFEAGVQSIAEGGFPSERILLILAVEARSAEEVKRDAESVREQYRPRFLDFLVAYHPDGVPGEARVKGANASHAARRAAEYLSARKIPFENVIVSCFDADTVVHADYFGCLTYHFMVTPARTRASYQPIPMYTNNIWDAPGFARILDIGSTFFQLVEASNPERLVTFSSHSMSFAALVEVGYWPVDMISDDSAIFWKSLIHFRGDYRVVPMFSTVYMDVNQAESWWKTAVNVYKQKRRWAWGAENIPPVLTAFLTTRGIPLATRLRHGYKLVETHVSWTTWPFLLGVASWLPAIFLGKRYAYSVVDYNEPRVLSTLFNLAFVGFLLYALLSFLYLPRRAGRFGVLKRLWFAAQWVLLPLVGMLFGAVPALDAQTRLMLGRYLEFWVTVKKRKVPAR